MGYPVHPDDEEAPRFGGWADDFATYDDACRYYGCDTPAQVAAEEAYYAQEAWVAEQDDLEAGGPRFDAYRSCYATSFDDLPF